ncbi:hypothetical protein IC575_013816 [Cucumis melo]
MILLLLFFSFFNLATTSELCFDSHCTGDYQTIRFPFRIVNGQPKSCGYPGFDLSCHPTVPSSSSYSSKLWDDLLLKWENPDCGRCESIGQRCELKSNSSNGIQCTNSQGRSRVGANVVSIAMGVVAAVICFLGLLCCLCFKINFRRTRSNSSNIAHWIVSSQGLNGLTIDSYPKFVLDESLSLPKPNNNVCPICLAQYRPKEIVKSIPNCQHCFHECCIDEWLRLKASCPVCRKSPLEAPPSNPPA